MIEQHEINRKLWEKLTPVHIKSEFYNVQGFLRGNLAIDSIEREGVGDVHGKSLLHLQCHFGLTTLSFARLGANVTGVDFSEASIAQANELAEKTSMRERSRFVCCDVLELDQYLNEKFDVVFTSYGVLTWLSDLHKWGGIVSRFLKPGGHFFMAELHPFSLIFHNERVPLEIAYDYFNDPAGIEIPPSPDFADPSYTADIPEHYWAWSLSDIFSALQDAKLSISEFREYPFSCYRQFPDLEKRADGFWHLPAGRPQLPLLFSLKARHQ